MAKLDLTILSSGERYEDRYGDFIKIFEKIALTPAAETIEVVGAPWCWWPLLYHLNCYKGPNSTRHVFPHCGFVERAMDVAGNPLATRVLDRTAVEVLCSFRPETVDALWKVDMQWDCPPGRVRVYPPAKEFIVTNNGSFHRPEVLDYIGRLEAYTPTKRKVLLVPCAADKPYPSPLHQACLDMLPDDFYLANATGVVGIVPQDLWPVMPWYDSGIPNEWRLFKIAQRYFTRHHHERIIVYCDYYALTLKELFWNMRMNDKVQFMIEPKFYADYMDLLDPQRLAALKDVLGKPHGL